MIVPGWLNEVAIVGWLVIAGIDYFSEDYPNAAASCLFAIFFLVLKMSEERKP
jgi:hypothetical protein